MWRRTLFSTPYSSFSNTGSDHRIVLSKIRIKLEITGRKSTQKGMIKGRNQKERLQTWYNPLQGLLGRPPEIDEDEPITQV